MKTKVCVRCKIRKSLDIFSKCINSSDGCQSWCNSCFKIYNHLCYVKDKKKMNKRHKEWIINNHDIIIKQKREWLANNSWYTHYQSVQARCTNPKNKCYKYYGGRGIKNLMISNDFKKLWFRDKAYLMKRPSIDRIDNNGNYVLKNCRFIEMSKNIRHSL